ncbi:MAG: hypothetical protein D6731_05280, partial [Planctomycetota bacterium]
QTSARQAKQTSARQAKQTSARQAKQTSARRAKQTSARLARPNGNEGGAPRPSSSSGRVTFKVHGSSSRLRPATGGLPPSYHRLAGPEYGLYLRGRARLREGRAVLELPPHFVESIQPDTLTVHLTPTADCRGLYVSARGADRVVVAELAGGRSAASFDYLLLAQRRSAS